MRKQTEAIQLDSTRVVKSKVPNQKVLRLALMLGMITQDEYTCLSAIEDSKEVDELARELATMGLDLLVDVLKQLARHELIEIT
jgi:lipopolysaccharide biosynthesis regulator YciM